MNDDIVAYIKNAIAKDLFDIHYQLQFSLVGVQFEATGAEALLRPDTKVCHIEKLIRVAISEGLIDELGYYIMRKTACQLRTWLDMQTVTSAFTMSVNVTAEQLQDKHFCSRVNDIVLDAEIDPAQLTIELTEASMINDLDIAKIYQISSTGVGVSIDDFGTGYSSLGRLKLLPINEIKIDKTFVDDIT